MKHFYNIFLAVLFIGCTSSEPKPKIYPQWYKNREITSPLKYEIIGYGEGKTLKEAKALAKESIAQTLISKVDSSIGITASDKDGQYKNDTHSNLKISSKLNLLNVKTIKQEQIDESFFVALKYKNLDLAYRVKTTIGEVKCGEQQTNTYLLQTPLLQKLTASIGCELDFQLDRKNKAWYIKYKENLFLLSDDEFEELFVSTKNKNFGFSPNKDVLEDGDSFYFGFEAKEEGFITLFNVYENGIVTLLQSSKPIKNRLQIPSDSQIYEAGLLKDGEDTYDLFVAIFSKEPLDMSRFEYANEDLSSSEIAYKFDELMLIMDRYESSSVLLKTRVKRNVL